MQASNTERLHADILYLALTLSGLDATTLPKELKDKILAWSSPPSSIQVLEVLDLYSLLPSPPLPPLVRETLEILYKACLRLELKAIEASLAPGQE